MSLADHAELLPGRGKRRTATLDLPWLAQQGYSHLLVHTARGSKYSLVHFDNWEPREREVSYTVPKWINFWRPLTVLEKTWSCGWTPPAGTVSHCSPVYPLSAVGCYYIGSEVHKNRGF